MPKGQPIGIPGRAVRHPGSRVADRRGRCATRSPSRKRRAGVDTSVIVLPLVADASVGPMRPDQGVLVSYETTTGWSPIRQARHRPRRPGRHVGGGHPGDRQGHADFRGPVQRAAERRTVAVAGLRGRRRPEYRWPAANLVIGSVFKTVTESGEQLYVVLPDGVAKINDTTAAALRATNSFDLVPPPSIEASAFAKIAEQVFVSPLPDDPLKMLLRQETPTLCWSWKREPGDQAARRRRDRRTSPADRVLGT